MKTCGLPLKLRFDALGSDRRFAFTFESFQGDESVLFMYNFGKHRTCNPLVSPTIIYVPSYQYPKGKR